MPVTDPARTRQFALHVVQQLRDAGYEALWAGGCVRDQLLGRQPKDYDVATGATPDEIRRVFGRRRTLSIGAAFGVITVLGPKDCEPVEVATFRRDAGYSDGRHPDAVTFSDAKEDALRRDFTINGLFYDPLADRVIDYVEGQQDLNRRLVRAIRDPHERIAEDKLRMLRAVRFAATFDFALDAATFRAVQSQAHEIVIVSAERVANEMRRMLQHRHRARAMQLLLETGLLDILLPESRHVTQPEANVPEEASRLPWENTLQALQHLRDPEFPVALAALLLEITADERDGPQRVQTICQRWRLSRHEVQTATRLLDLHSTIRSARQIPWPRLQRILVADGIDDLLQFSDAVAQVYGSGGEDVRHCRDRLQLPASKLDPPPLISGDDLIAAGIPPGPRYKRWLDQVRDAQLEGQLATPDEALQLVKQLARDSENP